MPGFANNPLLGPFLSRSTLPGSRADTLQSRCTSKFVTRIALGAIFLGLKLQIIISNAANSGSEAMDAEMSEGSGTKLEHVQALAAALEVIWTLLVLAPDPLRWFSYLQH